MSSFFNVRVWRLELLFEVLFLSLPRREDRLLTNQQNLKSYDSSNTYMGACN